jgi:uncharacterized protein YceK
MKRKYRVVIIICIACIPILIGCATIMHGTTQNIGISSTPTGASVIIDDIPRGTTPVFVDLTRKDNHIVKVEMPGYTPFEATIVRKTSGWVWGNIIFGGLIGLAVDAISGGLYKLTPDQVSAMLQEEEMSFLYRDDTLYIVVVPQPDLSWQRIGELQKAEKQ